MNATHDPRLRSWVESANDPDTDFPIQNLPFCRFGRVPVQIHGNPRWGSDFGIGVAIGDHDGSLLIVDGVGRVEFVVGLRSHTGEVMSVYLTDVDVEKLIEFLTWKHD